MKYFLYRQLLRSPGFRGKARMEALLRKFCFSSARQRVIHDLRMHLDPIEWTQAELLCCGSLEPRTTALFGELLHPGDTYLDIGAHVGFHTLVARHYVGDSGRVIAVEPQPYNCSKLLANWQANGFSNVVVYVAAAGERDGSITLYEQKPTDRSRLSLRLAPVNDQPQRFQVPMLRVDTICGAQVVERVRLLKVDAEGYELQVLQGSAHFADRVDHVILELLSAGQGSDAEQAAATVEQLQRLGFSELRTVEGSPWTQGLPLPENNLWASRSAHPPETSISGSTLSP